MEESRNRQQPAPRENLEPSAAHRTGQAVDLAENVLSQKDGEAAAWSRDNREELARLARMASLDPLTGLLNRSGMEQRISEALLAMGPEDTYALFMLDMDNFKQINDLLGHPEGDRCLSRAARDIARQFRSSDIVGRIGGDEFMAFLPRNAAASLVRNKAFALVDALQFTMCANRPIQLSCSVGVVIGRGPAAFSALYQQADLALYTAKNGGKCRYHIAEFNPGAADRPRAPVNDSINAVQLKDLLEYMDGGVILLELAEQVRQIYVSPGYCRMLGCQPDSYDLPRALSETAVHPEDIPGLEKALRTGAAQGIAADCIFRETADGQNWQWRHCRAASLRYTGSPYPVMVALITDISQFQHVLEMFQLIQCCSFRAFGIYEMGEPVQTLYCSEQLLARTGLTQKEYRRRVAEDATVLFHPIDSPDAYGQVLAALEQDRPLDLIYHANDGFWQNSGLMRAQGVKIGEQNGHPLILALFSDYVPPAERN